MRTHKRCRRCCGNETDAMTQFAESASTKNLIPFRQAAVSAILVKEGIYSLAVEKVLYFFAILPLPLAVNAAPLIVERNVHRHTP